MKREKIAEIAQRTNRTEQEVVEILNEVNELTVFDKLIITDENNDGFKRETDGFIGYNIKDYLKIRIVPKVGGVFINDEINVAYRENNEVYLIPEKWISIVGTLVLCNYTVEEFSN